MVDGKKTKQIVSGVEVCHTVLTEKFNQVPTISPGEHKSTILAECKKHNLSYVCRGFITHELAYQADTHTFQPILRE